MNAQERIEREVERTLACFGTADRLEGGPWFHARLMAEIHSPKRRERRRASWLPGMALLRPVLPIAFVVVNAVTVALVLGSRTPDAGNRETRLAALAERYPLGRDAYSCFPIGNEVR